MAVPNVSNREKCIFHVPHTNYVSVGDLEQELQQARERQMYVEIRLTISLTLLILRGIVSVIHTMSFKLYIQAIICHVFIAVIHKITFLVWGDIIIGGYVINNSLKTSIYYNRGQIIYIEYKISRKFNYSV